MDENNGAGGDLGGGQAPSDIPSAATTPPVENNADQGGEQNQTPAPSDNGLNLGGNMFDDPPEKTPDEKPTDPNKPAEEKPADAYDAEKAYSEFKYELPEGYALTEEKQKEYIEMAKAQGVKPEQLQSFVNKHIEAQTSQIENYKEIVKGWEGEIKADPVLGGDNFAATKKNVNNACSIDGGKEFREVLASTGLISNPAVVKYLNKLGTMINNDGLVTGGQSKDNATQEIKSIYTKSNY